MTTNTQILATLDFDELKQSLIDFFKSQPNFSDFNFEGSGLSTLLNILAQNSALNSYIANATINEAFLDSAVKRGSAISRAKETGYVPRSATSAEAIVNIIIPTPISTTGPISLDKFTPFTTTIGSNSYTFYNRDSITVFPSGNQYAFNNVQLFEGDLISNSYTVTSIDQLSDTTFAILNDNVDINSISVSIQNSASDSHIEKWNIATEMAGLDSTSKVFFVQCNSQEKYEILFGDGVIGKQLTVGNIVTVTYQVCHTSDPNVASNYTQTFSTNEIAGNSSIIINTVQNSTGGKAEETIDEIKFNAPLLASANNRAVTTNDYLAIINKYATTVKSCTVYGGDQAEPPVYGKVFISLEPQTGFFIPDTVKQDIANTIIKPKSVMTITPEFIDPDYIFLALNTQVKYDSTKTTLDSSGIVNTVHQAILDYVNSNLGKFQQDFYYSRMSRAIDDSNDSILGNTLKFNLQKRFTIAYGSPTYITCKYDNAVKQSSFYSNCFTYYVNNSLVTCNLIDDGLGNIAIQNTNDKTIITDNIGTINYSTGLVQINNLTINSITGAESLLKLTVTPEAEVSHILPKNNQIVMIDDSSQSMPDNVYAGITITAEAM